MRRAILLAALLVAGSAAADPAMLGALSRTNTVYTAPQVDALLDGAGGGADLGQVSNLVAGVVAEAGSSAAAVETWRIILADHQRRLDAIEDADGTDALTEAQAEQLVETRVNSALHDVIEEWGDTSGCIPVQTTTCKSTTISSSTSGVSANLTTGHSVSRPSPAWEPTRAS